LAHATFDFASSGAVTFNSHGAIDDQTVGLRTVTLRRPGPSDRSATDLVSGSRKLGYTAVIGAGAIVCVAWWSALLWLAVKLFLLVF
jgi:hypothetical protein